MLSATVKMYLLYQKKKNCGETYDCLCFSSPNHFFFKYKVIIETSVYNHHQLLPFLSFFFLRSKRAEFKIYKALGYITEK